MIQFIKGFRPQVDPEDHVINFNSNAYINPKIGSSKYIQNLENFLESSKCLEEKLFKLILIEFNHRI